MSEKINQHEFNKLLEQQARSHEDGKIHEYWYKQYKSGKLTFPEPKWHLDATQVDLSLQGKSTDQRLIKNGVGIIANVDIELLFDKMTIADRNFFRKKKLYESSGDRKISKILGEWNAGKKLIPPFMMIFDEEFKNTLNLRGMITSTEIMPHDGKHRLNVAYCSGCSHIPILVRAIQFDKISRMLA